MSCTPSSPSSRSAPACAHTASQDDEWHYILIQNLIQNHIHDLFPGLEVEQVYGFRITRNSDLYIDEEEAENLLRTIEDELRKRARGNAVRLEIEHACPPDMRRVLLDIFKLTEEDIYLVNGPLNFLHLMPLTSIDALASLRDKPYIPIVSHVLPSAAITSGSSGQGCPAPSSLPRVFPA